MSGEMSMSAKRCHILLTPQLSEGVSGQVATLKHPSLSQMWTESIFIK